MSIFDVDIEPTDAELRDIEAEGLDFDLPEYV